MDRLKYHIVRRYAHLLSVFFTAFILFGMLLGAEVFASTKNPKPKKNAVLSELEFKEAKVGDAVRVISELTGVNIVATGAAGNETVTLFVRNVNVEQAVDSLCRISGLWYRHNPDTDIYIVMTTDEYRRDIVVYRYEPTRMFRLKYLNVGIAARTIADLFGERVEILGKANRHLGDDFNVGDAGSSFSENYDEGDMDDGDDDDDDDDDNSKSRKRDKKEELTLGDMTANQLAMLEKMNRLGSQRVSEGQVSQVVQRTEATIYVTVNRLHNMLFVRTSDTRAMEEIARIIRESDEQVPEVLLEMKVLEVQLTDEFQSAFDISTVSGSRQTGPDDGHAVNPLNTSASSVGRSLLGLGNSSVMDNSSLTFQLLSSDLRLRLQLLQEKNNISSLATPMLLAANNHPAKLFIGEETVITTGFSVANVEVANENSDVGIYYSVPVPETEVREVGNTLTILPSINADRSVVMRIVHENSSVEDDGGKIPVLVGDEVQDVYIDTINTSTLEGTVLAQDGMTVAVGGMMRTSVSDIESKVPVLGDIPLLGALFRSTSKSKIKTELILLITPHVLQAPEQAEEVSRRRIEELTEHPNDIDLYLDSLARSRVENNQRKNDGKTAQKSGSEGLKQSYLALTKVAMEQVRSPFIMRKPRGRIRPLPMKLLGEVPMFDSRDLSCRPVACWTDGYHYVTAIDVTNRSEKDQNLDLSRINGTWQAATLEINELAPSGENGDSTFLYVVSSSSFETRIKGTID